MNIQAGRMFEKRTGAVPESHHSGAIQCETGSCTMRPASSRTARVSIDAGESREHDQDGGDDEHELQKSISRV